jgi:hypothetical protein
LVEEDVMETAFFRSGEEIHSAAGTKSTAFHQAVETVVTKTRESWAASSDEYLPLESVIGVGLGYAALTRDGLPLYEQDEREFDDLMTVSQAETLARLDPNRDWRIHLVALLDDRHYRRVGDGRWRLYRRGYGLS